MHYFYYSTEKWTILIQMQALVRDYATLEEGLKDHNALFKKADFMRMHGLIGYIRKNLQGVYLIRSGACMLLTLFIHAHYVE